MRDNDRLVCFAHGKESGPWGVKIQNLAQIAVARGWRVDSADYRSLQDPDARVRKLLDQGPTADRLVLCGSSMGGYVAANACAPLRADGLFLMAPALYLPGYPGHPERIGADTVVVHGWRDALVPADSAIRLARQCQARLHVIDDEHRLVNSLAFIGGAFEALLQRLERV